MKTTRFLSSPLWFKVCLYLSSILLLFIFIIVSKIDFSEDFNLFSVDIFNLNGNHIAAIAAIFLCISLICTLWLKRIGRGVRDFEYRVKQVHLIKTDYLTFLTTCILPIVTLDMSGLRYLIFTTILIVAFGTIVIRNDYYYANPTLSLLGYRLFEATVVIGQDERIIVMISRDDLSDDTPILKIDLGNNVWLAWKGQPYKDLEE